MSFIAETLLSTREFGLLPVSQIYSERLNCTILGYDETTQEVTWIPVTKIEVESKRSCYLISTVKKNRIVLSNDTMLFTENQWAKPEILNLKNDIWINKARIISTDIISEYKLMHKPHKSYIVYTEDNKPFFANFILVKELLETI